VSESAVITFTDGKTAEAMPTSITVAGIPGDRPGDVNYQFVYRTPGSSLWYVPLSSVLSIVFHMERPKRSRRLRRKHSQVSPTQVKLAVDKDPA